MKVRFWGVRGSIACPGPDTVKFGGNTLCLELRFGTEQRLIIVDAGSGIRPLGNRLLETDMAKGSLETEIFITHTHWDHIMGFPFFAPIYFKGTKIKVYGPVSYGEDSLEQIIGDMLQYRYFPVRHNELAAEISYYPLKECRMDIGDGIRVSTKYLNHPILCLGYRFEYQGKVLCTAFDTEPFRNLFAGDPADPQFDKTAADLGETAAREENRRLRDFLHNADLLIFDSQYTRQEYQSSKIGWGHTCFEDAIQTAISAKVKKVVLLHHDPLRRDDELAELERHHRQMSRCDDMEIVVAREGIELTV